MERTEIRFDLPEPYRVMRLVSRDPRWFLAEHAHFSIIQIIWVIDGVLELRSHHVARQIGPGQLCIIPPNVPHALFTECGYRQLGIDLSERDARGLVGLLESRLRGLVVLDHTHQLGLLPKIISTYKRLDLESKLRTAHMLDSILLDSIVECSRGRAFQQKLLSYIEKRLAEPFRVDEIARHIGVSRTHLERLTNREFGCSVMELVARVKTDAACSTLVNSDLTVRQIAESLGFYDPSHFVRFFKKRMGMSPTEFRRANR